MDIMDMKKQLNKQRICSKQLLNMLDIVEYELKNKSLVHFSFTILTSHVREIKMNLEEAWKHVLQEVIKKIYDFLKSRKLSIEGFQTIFLNYSIELHRDTVKIKKDKKNKKFSVEQKQANLKNYPHVHGFVSLTSIHNISDEDNISEFSFLSLFKSYFIDYDVSINKIDEKKKLNIKNSIKYILKEYKLNEINEFMDKYHYPKANKIVYCIYPRIYWWPNFVESINKISNHNLNKNNVISTVYMFDNEMTLFKNIKDPIYNIYTILHQKLFYRNHVLCGNFIYSSYAILNDGDFNSEYTWYKMCSLKKYLYSLAYNNLERSNLILPHMQKFLKLYDENKESVYICPFKVTFNPDTLDTIEYKDFIFNPTTKQIIFKNGKISQKVFEDLTCGTYFNLDKDEVLGLMNNINILKSVFKNEKEFIKYSKQMGYIFHNQISQKGQTMYLYGPSDTGKLLLTEKLLTKLYGNDEISILNNLHDKKFIFDQIKNKRILILNEFEYLNNSRSLLVKLLDGIFVEVNEKYVSSYKINFKGHSIATSNYSMNQQKMDKALQNRFKSIQTKNSINPREYEMIIKSLPLFIIYAVYSLNYDSIEEIELNLHNVLDEKNIIIPNILNKKIE